MSFFRYKGQRKVGVIPAPIVKTEIKKEMKKIAKRAVNNAIETKYHDRLDTALLPSDSPSLLNCTIISTGDSDVTRDGDKITGMDIEVRLSIQQNASATGPTNCRIIYFQWFDFNTSPSSGDILQYVGSGDQMLISPYNHDKKSQYRILIDRRIELPVIDQDNTIVNYTKKVKLKQTKLEFLGGGTAARWGVWCLYLSDYANASPHKPLMKHVVRLQFKDG